MTTFAAQFRSWLAVFVVVLLFAGCGKKQDVAPPPEVRTEQPKAAPKSLAPSFLEPEEKVFAKYAGSASCKSCHASQFASWEGSNHGLAERPVFREKDGAAFSPEHKIQHGTQASTAGEKDARFAVATLGFDGKHEAYAVARVVGNDPLRQFIVERPGGRFQTLELAFDPHKKEWFDVYGSEDRQPGEWGHWTGRGMSWNTMCANCHNTRLRKNYDAAADTFRTTMAEMSVGCEACHGPMKAHVDWRASHPGDAGADPTVVKMDRDAALDTCGSCHARRRELTGDFVPGDKFSAHYQLTTVDETDLYFPDGQIRDEVYEYGSFLSSKMHAAGVRCVDCHDPHRAKPVLAKNELCQRCHAGGATAPGGTVRAPVIVPAAHSFHKAESVTCQNCHMPVTTYMQRHPRHDHGFTIPDPLLTKEHGIPNACARCHADKDVDWAVAAADKWWGAKMNRPTRDRARLIADARAGKQSAGAPLAALVRSEPSPYWKASMLRVLGAWMGESDIARLYMEYAQHADPLVRTSAVQGLEMLAGMGNDAARQILVRKLEDADRSVRVAAAWGLRGSLDMASRAGSELGHSLELSADQPTGQLALGALAQARGKVDDAIFHFKRAVEWDSKSAALRHEYAVFLAGIERPAESLAQMREAVRLEPKNAEFRYKLALALNETGGLSAAIPEFENAVRIDPKHSRAWYNLGLARNQMRDVKGAVDALLQAEKADPTDPRIPYARATIHASARQPAEARAAAERALQIAPNMPEARQFLGL